MTATENATALRPLHTQAPVDRYLADMWSRRDFAVAMPVEQIRASHQDTLLGNIWHLGNPMLNVAVYYLVFGLMLNTDRGIRNFILWLTVGVFAYRLTQASVTGGARSISRNQGLLRSLRFPRALLPVSEVISRLLTFGFELGVLAVLAVGTGEGVSRRWLALPFVILVHTMLNLGGAFITARLNDSFRDVEQIVPYMFRLLRYVSGVMFPIERYLDNATTAPYIQRIFNLNPLVDLINLYRWVFLGLPMELFQVAQLVVVSSLVLMVGFWYFRRAELRYGRS